MNNKVRKIREYSLWRKIPRTKQDTLYLPPSQIHWRLVRSLIHQFPWSSTFCPTWSTSRGMSSWMGRTTNAPPVPRSTAFLWAPSIPAHSSTTEAFYHMCRGRRSSWRTMFRLEPCLTLILDGSLHGNFLTPGGIRSPSGSRSCLLVFMSWCAFVRFFPICGSVPEGNVVFRQRNGLVSVRSRCPGLWAWNSGWLRCWVVANYSSVTTDSPNTSQASFCGAYHPIPPPSPPSRPGSDELPPDAELGHEAMCCGGRGPTTTLPVLYSPGETFVQCQCKYYMVLHDVQ